MTATYVVVFVVRVDIRVTFTRVIHVILQFFLDQTTDHFEEDSPDFVGLEVRAAQAECLIYHVVVELSSLESERQQEALATNGSKRGSKQPKEIINR